jgi:lysophospholipase L1-like esterase
MWRAVSLLCAILFASGAALAQDVSSSSYITPFPPQDRYQVRVIGDWLASGLTNALQDALRQPDVQVSDGTKSTFSLTRYDRSELAPEVDRVASGGGVQIAVIMLGVNDRQYLRTASGLWAPGTAEWKEAYGKEAEKLIRKLRSANVSVYWAGLPPMANAALNDAASAMNDAVRQACYLTGARYIETWAGFSDQRGLYSAFGPDLTGQTKRLREADGVGFTAAGSQKAANYIEIVLKRDLAQARAQRNIPLAGDEAEQARVVPQTASQQQRQLDPAQPAEAQQTAAQPEAPSFQQTASEFARRDAAAFASSSYQFGELVLGDLGTSMTMIAVVSPPSDFSPREQQRQTPLAERLYYRVLSKGEALPSKEGRADDFRWAGSQAQSPTVR